MADPHDYPMARAWLATSDGEAHLAALQRFLEAMERERQVNSPEARSEAQEAALVADAAMAEATGSAALRRLRLLMELDPEATAENERDYSKIIDRAIMDDSRKGRIRLRLGVARMVTDLAGTAGAKLTRHVAAHMMETASGRIGLMHPVPMQGVDPETPAAFELRRKIIANTGYTVGQEVTRNRVPPAYWERAAKVHNALAVRLQAKGQKVMAVTAETIRTWCSREGGGHELFETSRAEGRRDRAAGKIIEERMLRAKTAK